MDSNNTEMETKTISAVENENTNVNDTVAVSNTYRNSLVGIKLISDSNLSELQKKAATNIYTSTKQVLNACISDQNMNNFSTIAKILAIIIKQVELISIEGKLLSGSDKKAVAIELGRIIIKEVTPNNEDDILVMYDLIAEPTLETMIEVSKVVNVSIQEMSTKCCPGLLELFKKKSQA